MAIVTDEDLETYGEHMERCSCPVCMCVIEFLASYEQGLTLLRLYESRLDIPSPTQEEETRKQS